MRRGKKFFERFFLLFLLPLFFSGACLFFSSCASRRGAVQAEEFFAIGMAFFDLGRFADAEIWLHRAMVADRTMVASEYNLGRIAFETGRFEDAARLFETILRRDPYNVMALRAAAYSRINTGDLEMAADLYDRVLALIPESADGGFNYALVLYALGRYEESEATLNRHPHALEGNAPSLLLLARAQRAQDRIEAIDSFANWVLAVYPATPNPQGLYEFALALESGGFYSRAIEQLDAAMEALVTDTPTLARSRLRFEKARILLIADPESDEGLHEMTGAVDEGFSDTEAFEALLENERLSEAHLPVLRGLLDRIRGMVELQQEDDEEDEDEDEEDDDEDDEESEHET